MTPAERKAKIAAAEALLNDVAADETSAAPVNIPQSWGSAQTMAQAQKQVAASVVANAPATIAAVSQAKTTAAIALKEVADAAKATGPKVAAEITGPGGNTRPTGQPTLLSTMLGLAKLMKGQK